MAKVNARIEDCSKAYREALEQARSNPTQEAWAKLLAAGKELSAVAEPQRAGRRRSKTAVPTAQELEGVTPSDPLDAEPLEPEPLDGLSGEVELRQAEMD